MRRVFYIPLKTISINNTYYGDKRHGMTADARDWQCKMFHYLSSKEYQQYFAELRENFRESEHGLKIGITLIAPHSELYTKEGKLSSRVHDVTNYEKSIIDVFCLKKYGDKPSPYGVQNLLTDDRYVKQVISRKIAGDSWGIRVSVTICPK